MLLSDIKTEIYFYDTWHGNWEMRLRALEKKTAKCINQASF